MDRELMKKLNTNLTQIPSKDDLLTVQEQPQFKFKVEAPSMENIYLLYKCGKCLLLIFFCSYFNNKERLTTRIGEMYGEKSMKVYRNIIINYK